MRIKMQNMSKIKFYANMRKNMRYVLCMKIRALCIVELVAQLINVTERS